MAPGGGPSLAHPIPRPLASGLPAARPTRSHVQDTRIVHGLIDPLKVMGFDLSAGIQLGDGRRLYAIFDRRSRRIMIVAHPVARGDMAAVALSPWTAGHMPLAGDLLDELVDPRNADGVQLALQLLRNGSL